ncbi:hypothetical protein [Polaromonas sp.]|uniref:hypothetical protein n=1 Tax=Polaromonas sp. TaxID=1869339 RepID=UPI0013BC1C84|nr:hypothetical protein [Polaromonas sp.]NDP65040.1 hypothetical protein [Polaromonas sp.]
MTLPHIPQLSSRLKLAVLIALLPACAPLPPAPRPTPTSQEQVPVLRPVGRITFIEGPNAFVDRGNHGAGQPAQLGQALLAGDRFYTGPGTRMKIDFWNGGYLEIDENTDPSLFQDLNCLVVSLFRSGRIFVDKSNACVESLGTKSQQFSKVAYSVMPAGAYLQITVVEGEARTLQPAPATVPAGWRIDLTSRGLLGDGRAYRVPEEAIRQSIGWTQYYRNRSRSTPAPEFPLFRLPFPPALPQPQYPTPDRRTPAPGRNR